MRKDPVAGSSDRKIRDCADVRELQDDIISCPSGQSLTRAELDPLFQTALFVPLAARLASRYASASSIPPQAKSLVCSCNAAADFMSCASSLDENARTMECRRRAQIEQQNCTVCKRKDSVAKATCKYDEAATSFGKSPKRRCGVSDSLRSVSDPGPGPPEEVAHRA
jgi:hypothetical protein